MLAENYRRVKDMIRDAAAIAGRDPAEIKLIAVTKTVGIKEVREAVYNGITEFGENRVQDAAKRVAEMPELNWHFIGHLQSNKVRDVLPYYKLIHSLDRISLAEALQNYAEKHDLRAQVLIQVNVSGEKSKFGISPDRLEEFLEKLCAMDSIDIKGLMTMAPFYEDPEETRPCFFRLRELLEKYSSPGLPLKELSMGMTNDFTIAIQEGATMIRVGSALFNQAKTTK